MAKTVKLADVAKAAGVSRGTASNVFSRPEIVRQEVRDKVLAVATALNYAGPDPRGRMLRQGKVNAIGVATAEPLAYFFDDPFARVVMNGISQACDARGAGISLVSAVNAEQLAWNMQSALVDGFVLFCIEGGSKLVELARERQLPFITLDYGFDAADIPSIGIDDVAGARMAAQHLIDLGHRRFAVLSLQFDEGGPGPADFERAAHAIYSGTRDRIQGYFEALAAAGISSNAAPIYETVADRASVGAGLEFLWATSEPPTAVLAMSDRVAMYALDWFRERGLSVPGDVSIVGFDDVPEAAMSEPPLTTVAQPMIEMGKRAVEAILKPRVGVTRDLLDISLMVRGSTGPAKR